MARNEKLLYQPNKNGYFFVLLYLAFNTAYTIFILKSLPFKSYIAFEVMLNIVLSLLAFLAAVKAKNYSKTWSIVVVILSIFEFARIFWVPKANFLTKGANRNSLILYLIIAGAFGLIGGLISVRKSIKRQIEADKKAKHQLL